MTTAPQDKSPSKLGTWVDQRIDHIGNTLLSDENIKRISLALVPAIAALVEKLLDDRLPAMEQALIDTVSKSADRVIENVENQITEAADNISKDINGVVDNVGQEVRSIPDTITHDIKSLLPPFLGGGG